jgi:cysteine-rich repeat protein
VFDEDAMARASGSAQEGGRWDTAWASLELAVCGNGVVEPGEDCDDGNTVPGDCCLPTCEFESTDTECRAAAGVCDVPDHCDGAGACTADAKHTSECRAAAGICDLADYCDGVAVECPADASVTECIDDDGCCPDGCSAADDDDCLQVPPLSWHGLALCFLLLAGGGIVPLRRGRASRSAKAVTSAVVIALALGAGVGDSAYRPESSPGTGSCLATHQPGADAKGG